MSDEQYAGDEYMTWDKYRKVYPLITPRKRVRKKKVSTRATEDEKRLTALIKAEPEPRLLPYYQRRKRWAKTPQDRHMDAEWAYIVRLMAMKGWSSGEICTTLRLVDIKVKHGHISKTCNRGNKTATWKTADWPQDYLRTH